MNSAIIFPNGSGGVAICYPIEAARLAIETAPAVMGETISVPAQPAIVDGEGNEITPAKPAITIPVIVTPAQTRPETDVEFLTRTAHRDVPAGTPFRFVPLVDIPTDRSERDLWTADFTNPDGIAGQP